MANAIPVRSGMPDTAADPAPEFQSEAEPLQNGFDSPFKAPAEVIESETIEGMVVREYR
jgi:hypothetical protein